MGLLLFCGYCSCCFWGAGAVVVLLLLLLLLLTVYVFGSGSGTLAVIAVLGFGAFTLPLALTAVPTTCDVTQDFYRRIDDDGCYNQVPHDYGRCAGGCGKLPDECCYKSNVTMQRLPFECPGGGVVGREVTPRGSVHI